MDFSPNILLYIFGFPPLLRKNIPLEDNISFVKQFFPIQVIRSGFPHLPTLLTIARFASRILEFLHLMWYLVERSRGEPSKPLVAEIF